MKKFVIFILVVFLLNDFGFSQGSFTIQNKQKSTKIRFKLINNLIIIPVEINGVTLSFLLDTGVSKPIIFNFLNVSDTLKIKNTETIFLRGLGDGESVEALKSSNNILRIGDAIKLKQDIFAIFDVNLNLAPKLGFPVHGIIGNDIFNDFIVEINYSKNYLRLTEPEAYHYKKCRKCETLNLEFYNNKPYINVEVTIDDKKIPVKLLIDSGGSDGLWLFENDSLGIKSGNTFFNDFLGHGLSGSVYGKRSKIDVLSLKSFVLENANVAYPDNASILFALKHKDRNGSLAGNVLKRFNVILDYQKATIRLKKNAYFKEKFGYNKSGIELAHDGVRFVKEIDDRVLKEKSGSLRNDDAINSTKIVIDTQYKMSLKPAYAIVEIRNNSPAQKAGLLIGDIILRINNKATHEFSLQKVIHEFFDDAGKHIRLKVDRKGKVLSFSFYLENPY
ncbi:aspartyl protease family protein [Mariniflexile litorale]|uniref:Aspartyl protease family protein n=1 Tax=Mariniflexile litorale TaxID=3045158 RepID=A0AAU7EID4_9FLAO|nr:aspartyl protease family protein [Mariniflexile sp. KMM 9835]MDQ8210107.1 aspartyl protease family protein [Mariniflexile sp. KMM 9835]